MHNLTHVGCFYFTIGNIHPKFRSTLKSIQLLALVKNEYLKKYGMCAILRHLVKDIAKLEKVRIKMGCVIAIAVSLVIISCLIPW